MFWMLKWVDSVQVLSNMGDILRVTRTVLARTNTAVTLIGRLSVWLVCLAISKAK
jgi:phosphatidylinositol glycan class O